MHLVYAKVIQSTKDIPALGFFRYYTTRVSLYMSGDHTEHIGNSFVLNPLRNSLPSYPPESLDLTEINTLIKHLRSSYMRLTHQQRMYNQSYNKCLTIHTPSYYSLQSLLLVRHSFPIQKPLPGPYPQLTITALQMSPTTPGMITLPHTTPPLLKGQ